MMIDINVYWCLVPWLGEKGSVGMKVTKAQAEENRAHIVETASRLFRERGYDGVGVADLMAAAGFTHGGFYKHFRSKADLIAEAAACGMSQTVALQKGVDIREFVNQYVSREHRDAPGTGCTMAALCGDAARQPEEIKAKFAAGIETSLAAFERDGATFPAMDQREVRAKLIDMFARSVGAIILSRACPDDSALADELLEACRSEILAALPSSVDNDASTGGPTHHV